MWPRPWMGQPCHYLLCLSSQHDYALSLAVAGRAWSMDNTRCCSHCFAGMPHNNRCVTHCKLQPDISDACIMASLAAWAAHSEYHAEDKRTPTTVVRQADGTGDGTADGTMAPSANEPQSKQQTQGRQHGGLCADQYTLGQLRLGHPTLPQETPHITHAAQPIQQRQLCCRDEEHCHAVINQLRL
jgi:hypothetical protein